MSFCALDSPSLESVSLCAEERRLRSYAKLEETQNKVHASLCDNFNTPDALAAILELVAVTNK